MPTNSSVKKPPDLSTGIKILDELLSGGIHQDLLYLFLGDKRVLPDVLTKISVIAQLPDSLGGLGGGIKVAFIDGNNRFNPYEVSKFAVSQHLSPQKVLENILISRAFTWDQMVEILKNRLSTLEDVKVVLVSGFESLFKDENGPLFEELLKNIENVKFILRRSTPLIIITIFLDESFHLTETKKTLLLNGRDVVVMINDDERYVEYILVQHPYLPENKLRKWKPRTLKKKVPPLKNTTIDYWF